MSIDREIRVIIPTAHGYAEHCQPTNGVPWGTQAEQVVTQETGFVGSIDYRLVPEGEQAITFLMKPGEGVDGSAELDVARYGQDPDLLAAVIAVRKKLNS